MVIIKIRVDVVVKWLEWVPRANRPWPVCRSKCGLDSVEVEDGINEEDEVHGRAVSLSLRGRGIGRGNLGGQSK